MKKIIGIFTLVFLIISGCMIYLVKKGVSLRTEPLIKPTAIAADQRNIATHVVLRLFPEMQSTHYILWGILPQNEDNQLLLTHFMEEYYKAFHTPVSIIQNGESATNQEIANCKKPCWILLPATSANELSPNKYINEKIQPLGESFFNMTIAPFNGTESVPDFCETQQRISWDCITPLSLRESFRKIKKTDAKYFFLRKYNERDFFLFIQRPN